MGLHPVLKQERSIPRAASQHNTFMCCMYSGWGLEEAILEKELCKSRKKNVLFPLTFFNCPVQLEDREDTCALDINLTPLPGPLVC